MIAVFSYLDLLGRQFVKAGDDPIAGFDCWGAARIVARRLGLQDPGPALDPAAVDVRLVALRAEPRALELGDIVKWDPRPGLIHVAPIVALGRSAASVMALHARIGHESCAVPISLFGRECAVYRLDKAVP